MTTLTRWFLAQETPIVDPSLLNQLFSDGWTLVQGLIILLVGWIIASIVRGVVKKVLQSTEIDNQIAAWIAGEDSSDSSIPIEKWVSDFTYWLIILFAVVAFLNTLQLEAVYEPLNSLLGEITNFLPKLLGAGILVAIAWVLAALSKTLITRLLGTFNLEQRLGGDSEQLSVSQTIGNAVYWLVILLFLPSILSTLQLEGTLAPVQGLLNEILAIIPNILAAVIIAAVGWVVAKIVQRVVSSLLATTPLNQVGEKFGLSSDPTGNSLSNIIGTVVNILILIPVAITALDALQIDAISEPATDMLNQVLNLLPKLFAATVVLGLAYVGGQYLSDLVTNVLRSVGFNNIFQWLGIAQTPTPPPTPPTPTETTEVPPTVPPATATDTTPISTAKTPTPTTPTRTPSEIAGIIVLVVVMLLASLTAVDILKIEALKVVVGALLAIAGQVLVGLAILALGLYLANLCFNLITNSGTRQAKFLGHTARISILIFVVAMALQQMGIAPNIVNLAFGLLVGGIAAAIALAFGLGGREVAGEQLREWLNNIKQN
ncbi:mechanosensitive ion channel [Cyanothece sp. BG0011]|uniref:mechanosensitive ion channel n=1 Tax=Cyanothece sp. BG0011 TaxID=2082950 RepID=UPI000D1D75B4|nr:mechanosensitive ion channel [Cyanothece sp. BG0011]